MKLRLRSIETKQTVRLEVPDHCSLHRLKQTLIFQLNSTSASPSSSIRLSLNRRDELQTSSPDDSLHSLGITSGDLIFYTFDPSSQTLAPPPPTANTLTATGGLQGTNFPIPETLVVEDSAMGDSVSETLVASGDESMEIDKNGSDGFGLDKYSEPFYLKRVLREVEEMGENPSNHKLLVIAVHAVVLESGLVLLDPVSGSQADRFHLADEALTKSVWYTLPEILQNRGSGGNRIDGLVKFQTLGRFVNVYGSLGNGSGSGLYRVCLDENRFAPVIESVWENRNADRRDGLVKESEVLEFWRIVKDGITLPLLIDLCAKAGLPTPPSLMRLPPELKMKVLEPLPGVDIAKVGSVCKELWNLANNDELWKQKYVEEFGSSGSGGEGRTTWKKKFSINWEIRELQSKAVVRWRSIERPYSFRVRRDPDPLFIPPVSGIIGGDYDRFPGFGVVDPTGQAHPFGQQPQMPGRFPARRNFSPNCNLGGSSG